MTVTYVVQRSVGADRAAVLEVSLLGHNGGDTARGESGRARTDENRQLFEELTFLDRSLQTEEVAEDANDGQKLVRWVTMVS